jgi:hypothetical protein
MTAWHNGAFAFRCYYTVGHRSYGTDPFDGPAPNHFDLLTRDPREPFKKIIDPRAAFEVFE